MAQTPRFQKQVKMEQQAHLLCFRERPLYPPPISHWSEASMTSNWQLLIGCHGLYHQSLGSQAGFNLTLMQNNCIYAEAATTLSGRAAIPSTHIQRDTRVAPDTEQVGKNETQPESGAIEQAVAGGRGWAVGSMEEGKKLRDGLRTCPGQGPLINSLSKSQLVFG